MRGGMRPWQSHLRRGGRIPSRSSGSCAEHGLGKRERPSELLWLVHPQELLGRAWSDERWGIPWSVAGLLAELAFAFPTHEDQDAHGAQNPRTDEPADPEAVPVIVERTVFIFGVVGFQGRQACQEDEQAQGHQVLHVDVPALEGSGGRVQL